MTDTITAAQRQPTLTVRSGASRKLLTRKAVESAGGGEAAGETIEALFPVTPTPPADGAAPGAPQSASPQLQTEDAAAAAHAADPKPSWSDEDERALQALQARRKAAGYQRRGKDVGGQTVRVGDVAPNPDTIVAVIVGLVAGRGSVSRADLIGLMADASFPHPKAQPKDKGWCQGYVAGAVRSGFLALGDASPDQAAEAGNC